MANTSDLKSDAAHLQHEGSSPSSRTRSRDVILEVIHDVWLHLRLFEDGRISYAVVREEDKFGERLKPLPLE